MPQAYAPFGGLATTGLGTTTPPDGYLAELAGFWPYRDAQRRPAVRINDSHFDSSAAQLLVADTP
jgi:hypothetical protein